MSSRWYSPLRLKPAALSQRLTRPLKRRSTTDAIRLRADHASHRQFPAPAQHRDIFPPAHLARAGQQAPGLAVFLVLGFAGAVGAEMEHGVALEGLDGDDVPDVFGDDVSGEEVDVVLGVVVGVAAAFDRVLAAVVRGGTFDLHAPEAVAGIDHDVVGVALSPESGDGETQAGCSGQERGLGGFSATLAVGSADGVEGDGFWCGAGALARGF